MATFVLVHEIAQEQKSADTLEEEWLPDLTGGVRTAGFPEIADRLYRLRSGPGGIDTRMAFDGDLPDAPVERAGGARVRGGACAGLPGGEEEVPVEAEEVSGAVPGQILLPGVRIGGGHARAARDEGRNDADQSRTEGAGIVPGVEQRNRRPVYDGETGLGEQLGEPARQVRVGEVLIPRGQHLAHAADVAGPPDDGLPVGVEHEQPATRPQDPVSLRPVSRQSRRAGC
jgi:hypothetical protein